MIRCLLSMLLLGTGISFGQNGFNLPVPPLPVPSLPLPFLIETGNPKAVQVPQFMFWGTAQCDDDSNLYFHANSSYRANDVVRITGSTGEGLPFRVTSQGKDDKDFGGFSVSPNGTVWLLLRSDPSYYSLHFSSDGSPQSPTRLQIPEYLEIPEQFAVNNDGTALLRGYFGTSASEKLRGKPYAALVDASGKVIRKLSGEGDVDLKTVAQTQWDGYVGATSDGRFYLFDPGKITILSAAGEVERTLPFSKPKREQKILRGMVNDGLIVLWVSMPNKDAIWETEYLILDADTGEQRGLYAAPRSVGLIGAGCFSRQQGFTFLQNSYSQLSLVRAKLP